MNEEKKSGTGERKENDKGKKNGTKKRRWQRKMRGREMGADKMQCKRFIRLVRLSLCVLRLTRQYALLDQTNEDLLRMMLNERFVLVYLLSKRHEHSRTRKLLSVFYVCLLYISLTIFSYQVRISNDGCRISLQRGQGLSPGFS